MGPRRGRDGTLSIPGSGSLYGRPRPEGCKRPCVFWSVTAVRGESGRDGRNGNLPCGAGGVIACPAAGSAQSAQDAQHRGVQPAYQDNDDGTVADRETGLTWEKDRVLADGQAQSYTRGGAKDCCEALTLGGCSDWRTPTIKELFSIATFGRVPSGGDFWRVTVELAVRMPFESVSAAAIRGPSHVGGRIGSSVAPESLRRKTRRISHQRVVGDGRTSGCRSRRWSRPLKSAGCIITTRASLTSTPPRHRCIWDLADRPRKIPHST